MIDDSGLHWGLAWVSACVVLHNLLLDVSDDWELTEEELAEILAEEEEGEGEERNDPDEDDGSAPRPRRLTARQVTAQGTQRRQTLVDRMLAIEAEEGPGT